MKIIAGKPPKLKRGPVALDLEMFNMNSRQLHRPSGEFALLSITDGKNVWMIEDKNEVPAALKAIDACTWIFHNASFDVRQLRAFADIQPRPPDLFWDTLLMERILFGGWYDEFDLAALSRRWLERPLDKEVRKEFSKSTALTKEMKKYAASDVIATWQIYKAQRDYLKGDNVDRLRVWEEIDCPAFWAVLDFKGFMVDRKRWEALAEKNQATADRVASELGFNPGSPLQVKKALAKAHINVADTRELTLLEYKDRPVVSKILMYRDAAKRASTYGRQFVEDFVEADGRVYSEYQVVKAETGRMASGSPNMQNQPREVEYRSCFIAAPGHKLLIADYSQQEPRIAAALSGDVELLRAFQLGEDVHLTAARAIYHDPNMTKDDPRRKIAKSLNLGLIYGLTAGGLALRTGLDFKECERLVEAYFKRFAGLKRWIDGQRQIALSNGYVQTVTGRRIYINPYSKQWGNNAINAPIQGSAADVTKLALAKLHQFRSHKSGQYPLDVVGVVHDEIILEVQTKLVKSEMKLLQVAMEEAFAELVPQVSRKNLVDISIGNTWADKH